MSRKDLHRTVLETLAQIAPEAAEEEIDPEVDFRDQIDFDSMDFFNFVIALHEKLDVDIPERDYPRLSSLDGAVEYLESKVPESG